MRALSTVLCAALVSAASVVGCLSIAGLDEDFTEAGTPGGGGNGPVPCEPLSEADCYDGPQATKGVGLCVGGKKTCNAQGTAYGDCVGQALPAAEDCLTLDKDENCDGKTPSCPYTALWSKRFGEENGSPDQSQFASEVAIDEDGNVFITGGFFGDFYLGDHLLENAGYRDLFLAKFDAAGNHLWSKAIGSSSHVNPGGLSIDVNGNCVLTGGYEGDVSFDFPCMPLPHVGSELSDIFVAVFNGDTGACVSSKGFGGPGDEFGIAAFRDAQGNTTVVGQLDGTVDFDGNILAANQGMFALKLGPNNNSLWSYAFDGAGNLWPKDMAAAEDGDGVVVAGTITGTVNFGSGCDDLDDLNGGMGDGFVVALRQDGTCRWSKRLRGGGKADAFGVAAVPGGGAVVVGSFENDINCGADTDHELSSPDGFDIFVTKLTASGACDWSKRFGGAANEAAMSVALMTDGDIVIAGYFAGQIKQGENLLLESLGSKDAFVARLDAGGELRWIRGFGDADEQDALGVALAPESGEILVTGEFAGTMKFGDNEVLVSTGLDDIFLAKLSP